MKLTSDSDRSESDAEMKRSTAWLPPWRAYVSIASIEHRQVPAAPFTESPNLHLLRQADPLVWICQGPRIYSMPLVFN